MKEEFQDGGKMVNRDVDGVVVLIPAYNPDEKLLGLIAELKGAFRNVVVVNDGSIVGCDVFDHLAEQGVSVVVHDVNRGKGAALKTGCAWIRGSLPGCRVVVTADADGQHRLRDIARVADAALENPDTLTLGVRAFTGNVPLRSRFGNWWTRQFFFLATRMRVADTQTGLRGIPVGLLPRMLELPGERYEYEMAMLADARNYPKSPVQVPIETVYVAENASSHFNPLVDSLRVCSALVKFCMSSVACFLIDNVTFTAVLYAVSRLAEWKRATAVLVAIIIARAISATANYVFNRKLVFKSNVSKGRSFMKYWMLVLFILAAGYLFTAVLSRILDARGFVITMLKIAVETGLFFMSYKIQKRWIFCDAAHRANPRSDPA